MRLNWLCDFDTFKTITVVQNLQSGPVYCCTRASALHLKKVFGLLQLYMSEEQLKYAVQSLQSIHDNSMHTADHTQ